MRTMPVEPREPTPEDRQLIVRARDTAFVLYEGVRVPHRSCGIALAETFGLPTRPYQSLRRGGITGEGECGAIKAGELILGELLGDPDPAGPVTAELRAAAIWYQRTIRERLGLVGADIVCNTLTRRHGDFASPERKAMCTHIAAEVAAVTAEAILRHGGHFTVPEIESA